MGSSDLLDNEVLKELEKIKSYPWVTPGIVEDSLKSVKELIAESIEAGLSRGTECGYAGTKFLFSLLEAAGKDSADSIEEANEIFTVGMRIADKLWGFLKEGIDPEALDRVIPQYVEKVWHKG